MRMLPPPGWADAACSRPRKTESAPRWPASPLPFLRFRKTEGDSVSLLGRFVFVTFRRQQNGDDGLCCVRLSPTTPGSCRTAWARDRTSRRCFQPACFGSYRAAKARDGLPSPLLPACAPRRRQRGYSANRLRQQRLRRTRSIAFGVAVSIGVAPEPPLV